METPMGDSVTYDKENFLTTYKKLPKKSAVTIRLFERGEKYAVYGEDTTFVTKELSHTCTGIKKLHNRDLGLTVDYYNFPKVNSDLFIRDLLLLKQKRVEVWINKGKAGWVAEYKGSPGNLTQFEDLIFSNVGVCVNNGVVGIRLGSSERNKMVGIAYVNTNECIIHLIEFLDNEAFSNLESVIIQLWPKEAVVVSSSGTPSSEDMNKVQKILERNAVMINPKKLSDFHPKDIVQDLGRLLKTKKGELHNVAANPELDKQLAASALACTIKYLDLLSNEVYFNQFSIQAFDFSLYVKMDSSAANALHLVPNPFEIAGRNTTLLSFLDKCRTQQGHRLLAQWIRMPILDKDKLEERLDLVEIFVNDVSLRHALTEEHLRRVPDCQSLARKFAKKKASLQDCYKSYVCLVRLPKLVDELEGYDGNFKSALSSAFIDPIKTLLNEFKNFIEMVKTTLDLDLADEGEFMISSRFDDTLHDLRQSMDEIKKQMEIEASKIANVVKLDDKSVKLESNNMFGYYVRVTMKEEKAIRNKSDLIILDSNKAGVRFRNKKLEILNEKHQKKINSYLETQKRFTEEILDVAAGYHSSFEQLGNVMALLDVISNLATVALNSSHFSRPKLHARGTGLISFNQLRHPLIEAQTGVNFIPNDITFEKGKDSFYILTGPNMGGKSTFLRSVGIATLLAQIGSFVPADCAEVSIVDAILARVGAQDSLVKGVSTFMAEMIETSFILKTATSDSLVLIDELGRGTSTYDGFGLCYAISKHLASVVDCYCLLATHFHELTSLSDEVSSVSNIHVTALANENGLALLYKIEKGPCDRSFGLHVAEVTDFPPDVIQSAKAMVAKLEDYCSEFDNDDSEAAVKRRKLSKQEGEKIMDKFLQDIEEIKSRTTSHDEFQVEAKQLFQKVKESNNSYLIHLLENIS